MSEEEPPRKKHKTSDTSGSSRILRSQAEFFEEVVAAVPGPSLDSSGLDSAAEGLTARTQPETSDEIPMSESRRRSSRKSRNDELRSNEQNIATGSTPAKTTSTSKQTPNKMPMQIEEKRYSQPLENDQDEEAMDEDEDEDEDANEDELEAERNAGKVEADAIGFSSQEARFLAAHRARAAFGLSTVAGLLSTQASQLKSLLGALREPDPSVQLIALNELATILSMSTEDSIAGYIQTDAFVTELVNIMRGPDVFGEENPDMMLLACRCLANLMEALPSSTANVAYGGAIPVLCQKLLEIQYIDLAEQALSTLEKISKEYPTSIVREGGLAACLTYLDFFSTNVQRIAVNTAANCARNIPEDSFPIVRDVISTLQSIILGSDQKVVEGSCLCLTRILESFKSDATRIEELLTPELLLAILSILSPLQASGSAVSDIVQTRFLHVLGFAARMSSKLSVLFMQNDIVATIYHLLTGLSKPATPQNIKNNSVFVLQALIHRPKEQVAEILTLVSELLPGLPEHEHYDDLSTRERGSQDDRSRMFLEACPENFETFASIVLPTLMDIYNSTVNIHLRKTALFAILKLCYNLEPEFLKRVVGQIPLAVFVAGVLSAQDPGLVLSGIRIANILLRRVESIYVRKLAVEGCVDAIEALSRRYSGCSEHNLEESLAATAPLASQSTDACGHDDETLGSEEDEDEVESEDEDENEEIDEVDLDEDEADVTFGAEDEASAVNAAGVQANAMHQPDQCQASDTKPRLSSVIISLGKQARAFIYLYQSIDKEGKCPDETLLLLRTLAETLDSGNLSGAFDLLNLVFQKPEEVSSYYLRSSGVLRALLSVLNGENRFANRQLFSRTCMPNASFRALVGKLQELLSRSERFDIITTSSSDDRRSANVLARQLKLKLVADESSQVPKPYRNLMVSIHAIATFKALDDYLRPRIISVEQGSARTSRTITPLGHTKQSLQMGRHSEGLQGALAQLAAAGAALPDSIRERLSHLGVEPESRKNTSPALPEVREANVGRIMEEIVQEKTNDTTGTVSVEVAGSHAIARTEDGNRIYTPRAATPVSSIKSSSVSQESTTTASTPRRSASKQTGVSYAAAVTSVPQDYHIEFEISGKVVSHETTIFGGVRASQPIGDASAYRSPLSAVYQVKFRKVQGPPALPERGTPDLAEREQVPMSLQSEPEAFQTLQLLDVLCSLNSTWKDLYEDKTQLLVKHLPDAAFMNTKLTAKLNRQLEEPLIVASSCLPSWSLEIPRFYPFLFPFETRFLFLQSTSFGYSRSMSRWQTAATKGRDDTRSFLGRLQRQKVRILRSRMLESTIKVMELYGSSPSVLEVEYFDEVGTGLGPTLEFYSTVSRELSKRRLHIWRQNDSSDESEYVFSQNGLFPSPLPLLENEDNIEPTKRVLALFTTMGIFIARSMMDSRIIDIPFNPLFFRIAAASANTPLTIGMVYAVDKHLARSLSLLKRFSDSYKAILADQALHEHERIESISQIRHDNASISELAFDFTYPGAPEIELVADGAQIDVDITNVAEYIDKVVDLTLGSGIGRQLAAFREGFSTVFPYTALRAFTADELTMIYGRSEEDWSRDTLLDSLKADHGYSMESGSIKNLVSVLSGLSLEDRRRFLQFITGSPRLPIGGFKSLTPQFTVVCKHHEAPLGPDDYLPSVMTCVNYLKLPDYSTLDVLRSRLTTAFNEGGESFHLS